MVPTGDGKIKAEPPAGEPAARAVEGEMADKDSAQKAYGADGGAERTGVSSEAAPPKTGDAVWDGLRSEAAALAKRLTDKLRESKKGGIPSAAEVAEWRAIEASIEGIADKAKELAGIVDKESARLREELAALRIERDRLKDALAKARADFLDYQAREARERKRLEEQTLRSYMLDLLPIFDGIDMAMKHIEIKASAGSLAEAFRLLADNFRQVVAPRGLEPIKALGATYDPILHKVSAFRPASKDAPDKTVVEELRKGYTWKGFVLRPAEVVVARDEAGKSEGGDGERNEGNASATEKTAGRDGSRKG